MTGCCDAPDPSPTRLSPLRPTSSPPRTDTLPDVIRSHAKRSPRPAQRSVAVDNSAGRGPGVVNKLAPATAGRTPPRRIGPWGAGRLQGPPAHPVPDPFPDPVPDPAPPQSRSPRTEP